MVQSRVRTAWTGSASNALEGGGSNSGCKHGYCQSKSYTLPGIVCLSHASGSCRSHLRRSVCHSESEQAPILAYMSGSSPMWMDVDARMNCEGVQHEYVIQGRVQEVHSHSGKARSFLLIDHQKQQSAMMGTKVRFLAWQGANGGQATACSANQPVTHRVCPKRIAPMRQRSCGSCSELFCCSHGVTAV